MTSKLKQLSAVGILALSMGCAQAIADDLVWHHAATLAGEPKYAADFPYFEYVNPGAPKGGEVRMGELGGFDTFNPILPQGETASGLGLIYETLLTSPMDETGADYGLIAEALAFPDDFSFVSFRINPKAHWQDGQPITPEDVVWSFEKLIEVNPNRAQYYANVVSAEVTAVNEVTFTFDTTGNRELPKILGQLPVLPKHWWEANKADGEPRDVGASTLEIPMGSGPYQIESFIAGRTVTYSRVKDYWAANEPVQIGHNNFDTIRYEYFRDSTVQFEAFKGDQIDWWMENVARRWATAYDIASVQDGRMVRERFENPYRSSGLMMAFILNSRLEKFGDVKVREALNYAFDFEQLQRDIFFGEYLRVNSYFYRTELASSGLPQGEELAILESVRDLIPAKVFDVEYTNPVSGDPAKLRANLRQALNLLTDAGYALTDGKLVNAAGEQLSFEILLGGPTIEPIALAWEANLAKIGIEVSVRTVDTPQYINRVRSRDFDVIYTGWPQSLSPGNEQRFFWGSEAAGQDNSSNYAGIADPGIDALIEKIIFSEGREALVAATRALDRVLLANHFVVPTYAPVDARIAHWDRFSHPEKLPEFAIGFPAIWWDNPDGAAAK